MPTRALAARAGVAHGTVHALETGLVTDPSVSVLWRLADALGCRRGWLLAGEGHPYLPCSLAPGQAPRGQVGVVEDIPPEQSSSAPSQAPGDQDAGTEQTPSGARAQAPGT